MGELERGKQAAEGALLAAQNELEDACRELEEVSRRLGRSRREHSAVREQLADAREALSVAREELTETKRALFNAHRALAEITKELLSTKEKLAGATEELAVARRDLDVARSDLDSANLKLSAVSSRHGNTAARRERRDGDDDSKLVAERTRVSTAENELTATGNASTQNELKTASTDSSAAQGVAESALHLASSGWLALGPGDSSDSVQPWGERGVLPAPAVAPNATALLERELGTATEQVGVLRQELASAKRAVGAAEEAGRASARKAAVEAEKILHVREQQLASAKEKLAASELERALANEKLVLVEAEKTEAERRLTDAKGVRAAERESLEGTFEARVETLRLKLRDAERDATTLRRNLAEAEDRLAWFVVAGQGGSAAVDEKQDRAKEAPGVLSPAATWADVEKHRRGEEAAEKEAARGKEILQEVEKALVAATEEVLLCAAGC